MKAALFAIVSGCSLIVAGVYLNFGVGWSLVCMGGLLVAAGFLVDLETE